MFFLYIFFLFDYFSSPLAPSFVFSRRPFFHRSLLFFFLLLQSVLWRCLAVSRRSRLAVAGGVTRRARQRPCSVEHDGGGGKQSIVSRHGDGRADRANFILIEYQPCFFWSPRIMRVPLPADNTQYNSQRNPLSSLGVVCVSSGSAIIHIKYALKEE